MVIDIAFVLKLRASPGFAKAAQMFIGSLKAGRSILKSRLQGPF